MTPRPVSLPGSMDVEKVNRQDPKTAEVTCAHLFSDFFEGKICSAKSFPFHSCFDSAESTVGCIPLARAKLYSVVLCQTLQR